MSKLEPSKPCKNCGKFYIQTSIHEVSEMCCKKCADNYNDDIVGKIQEEKFSMLLNNYK